MFLFFHISESPILLRGLLCVSGIFFQPCKENCATSENTIRNYIICFLWMFSHKRGKRQKQMTFYAFAIGLITVKLSEQNKDSCLWTVWSLAVLHNDASSGRLTFNFCLSWSCHIFELQGVVGGGTFMANERVIRTFPLKVRWVLWSLMTWSSQIKVQSSKGRPSCGCGDYICSWNRKYVNKKPLDWWQRIMPLFSENYKLIDLGYPALVLWLLA